MEVAPEGPEDMVDGGPGEEGPKEVGLLGIAQGGLPEVAPVKSEEHKPNETQNTMWAKENQSDGQNVPCRAPRTRNLVVAPLGPSSAEPGVRRDFAQARIKIQEKEEALQRQISLLDADLHSLLLEEDRD